MVLVGNELVIMVWFGSVLFFGFQKFSFVGLGSLVFDFDNCF